MSDRAIAELALITLLIAVYAIAMVFFLIVHRLPCPRCGGYHTACYASDRKNDYLECRDCLNTWSR